jgi:hypothetical protein
VIGAGEQVPDIRVWRSTREPAWLRALAGDGPYLLLFYLFDWSST